MGRPPPERGPDHPRIRGEHPSECDEGHIVTGSSPHTRGARFAVIGVPFSLGIIPAYAGSTSGVCYGCVDVGDHPRIRGEHAVVRLERQLPIGSSPHTRGAPPAGAGAFGISRIIPAYAGSTPPGSRASSSRQDHPRIRGEHTIDDRRRILTNGSSPHTRGARSKSSARRGRGRIIPAYAGSTYKVEGGKKLRPDHPRIRGEHMSPQALPPRVMGSSPHTRGALFVGDTARKLRRIIPAYAGSTECQPMQIMSAGDHPRIRGEHSVSWLQSSLHWGSSPHTRGAPGRSSPKRPRWRIIPAYAGSTTTAT